MLARGNVSFFMTPITIDSCAYINYSALQLAVGNTNRQGASYVLWSFEKSRRRCTDAGM